MQPISPATVELVQVALRLERAAMSYLHDAEHASRYQDYGKLEAWYDKRVHESRCRRRRLLDYLFANDDIPDPSCDAPAATMDPADGLGQAQDLLMSLCNAYRAVFTQGNTDGDAVAEKIATCGVMEVSKTLCKIEAKLEQLEAMGQQVWLTTLK
jgi:hypothetical protein